jgi:rhodanese-related sulfurtransferase
MLSPDYSISPQDLWNAIATQMAPQIIDVRRHDAFEQSPHLLPGALWRDAGKAEQWEHDFDPTRPIIAACKAGHEMSQATVAQLRADGIDARVLEGGYEGWTKAGLPFVAKMELERIAPRRPSIWVTRRRPKIDRIACPWLIRRFIDPQAEFIYVPAKDVLKVAKETGGTPYDIDGVEFTHEGERCSFDTILRIYGIKDAALDHLAEIVRGADTSRHDLAPQCGGLFAISLGLSANFPDDHEMLGHGMVMYDALYTWCRSLQAETHNWPATAVKEARRG